MKKVDDIHMENIIDAVSEIGDIDARHAVITEALIDLSYMVEDGRISFDDARLERIAEILKAHKETVLGWDGLYDDIKAYRKDFPKSHWWWYPEKW